jgi:chemotaxis protein MotB
MISRRHLPVRAGSSSSAQNWLVTYAALFTSLLALLVLNSVLEMYRGVTPKIFSQRVNVRVHQDVLRLQAEGAMDWLTVENTVSKGSKFLIPAKVQGTSLFRPGRADINPLFEPYLIELAGLFKDLSLRSLSEKYRPVLEQLARQKDGMNINLRVEGHSDRMPIFSRRYRDNWELSTARAYSVLQFLQQQTGLPEEYFSLAGYGSFHPLKDVRRLAENRRAEVYLDIQMLKGMTGNVRGVAGSAL